MYVAHTSEDGRLQCLREHLENVARMAGEFAEAFGAKDWGELAGIAHDLGKYSREAQRRILENGPKVDHATAGAQEVKEFHRLVAYCVAGHHAGLPDGGTTSDMGHEPTLTGRLKKTGIPDYSTFRGRIQLNPVSRPAMRPLEKQGFSISFFTRMLFSCLVDADFLDTERFMKNGRVQRGGYEEISTLLGKLERYIRRFDQPDEADPQGEDSKRQRNRAINRKRNQILQNCLDMAHEPRGLYTLTVPAGGGKTIASMAFALKHATHHGMKRVIYVIPYTSIIEQNARVFRDILGDDAVIEHHTNIDYDNQSDETPGDYRHLAIENWDAPVVVTTNVQFFESLFARRTSRCRKLHNIVNSVIIFDEAQMIPLPFLKPCVRAIAELVHNYGCTAVLCSATQPALQGLFPAEVKSREIAQDVPELFRFFRRTRIVQAGALSDEALAERLNSHRQVLCVVGTRKHAQNLYARLQGEGCFHLSTLMYPLHRRAVIREVRRRLKENITCRLVSTSLIEAGVDLDFPVAYRAKAGLDSQIQTAGRCNREGRETAENSPVYVFEPEEAYCRHLPAATKREAEVAGMTAQRYEDVASPEAVEYYFNMLYRFSGDKTLDSKDIVARLEAGFQGGNFPFTAVAQDFQLIDDDTLPILIPLEPEARILEMRLRSGERSRGLLRSIGPYCVNVYPYHMAELVRTGTVERLDGGIAVLLDSSAYSFETGLTLSQEEGRGIMI